MRTLQLTCLVIAFGSGWNQSFCQPVAPKLSALAAIVMDAETGQVIYKKNADLRLHPASTTKIMTGLLLAEHCQPTDILTAPLDVSETKESSAHLMPGEQLTASEMLYALMLRSANDGCHTVACHIAGNEEAFAKLMNERAKEIGCTNTTFINPHGLTNPNHLTTARDLALIARVAVMNPDFAKVVATQKHVLQRSLNLKDTVLFNRDKWLAHDPRARGVKTGWTKPAGHCFVGYASAGGMKVITAILKSDKWLDDQKALVNWTYDCFERKQLVTKGEVVGQLKVEKGHRPTVGLLADRDVWRLVPKGAQPDVKIAWNETPEPAPISSVATLRTASVAVNGEAVGSIKLFASEPVKETSVLSTFLTPGGAIGFCALSGAAIVLRARNRRWTRNL